MDNKIKELIEKSKNKDEQAFSELFDLYYDRILNYVWRRVLNVEYAKDITSNTFLKVLKNIQRFECTEEASFNGWIYKIATNEINQYFRKQNKYHLIIDDENNLFDLGDDNKAAEEIEKKIDNDKYNQVLNKSIRQLKPIYQDILHLRYFEEMSYKEISEVINKNETTIRV